ncbi:MAG: MqnA/MqnD/SBP family protein, partial [Rikenellaceae bacterium]
GGEVDAGVLIHEERFLYREKGLHLISDLGAMWEEKSGLATPLGAIVIRRDTDVKVKKDINSLVANSVKYAFDNPLSSLSFVRDNAKELDEKVMKRHIEMFVNQYSLNLGAEGQESVERFFKESGVVVKNEIFVK